jgi:arabinose-5-phosphate isomerase
VILEISKKRLGTTAVTDEHDNLLGIITDGDLRRMLEKDANLAKVTAREIMTVKPKTIAADALAVEALDMLRQYDISQLAVTDGARYVGIIHLHDLIREGLI